MSLVFPIINTVYINMIQGFLLINSFVRVRTQITSNSFVYPSYESQMATGDSYQSQMAPGDKL